MEEAYSNLNNAYLQIKGMIVVEGFYALVAGFVITTFVFKLAGIIKEMVHEGKGFNAKQFYELGREYILCIALICIMPVLLDTLETVLAYAADRLMESLAAGGVYNPDNIWKKPIEQAFDDLMNSDIIDIAVNGLDTTFNSLLAGAAKVSRYLRMLLQQLYTVYAVPMELFWSPPNVDQPTKCK